MQIADLIEKFRHTRDGQGRAIFSTIFIAGNRLQASFDRADGQVTLKQFMLLTMLRQSGEDMTFTQLGELLGCSRQNIKKLAASLEKKGLVTIITEEGKRGDALSTSMFVKGLDEASRYWRDHQDFEMLLVTQDGQIYLTEGIEDQFTLSTDFGNMETHVIKRDEQ